MVVDVGAQLDQMHASTHWITAFFENERIGECIEDFHDGAWYRGLDQREGHMPRT